MKFNPLLFLGALALGCAHAAEENATTLAFSDPSQPGRLRAVISNGDIRIRGGDVTEVIVHTSAEADDSVRPREDGLRVIASSAQFTATEADNVITLEYGTMGWANDADFDIVVPRQTSIQLQSNFGGDVVIENLEGDVEVKNMNGEILLRGLGGGALVETMNGEIDATFVRLPEGKPLAFSSMNGEILLRVPAEAKANVRFRTQNGSILTDFDPDALVTKTESSSGATYAPVAADVARIAAETAREAMEVARAVAEEVRVAVQNESGAVRNGGEKNGPRVPRAPRPPSIPAMAGGKVVSGTLNGGGTEVQIATMNGDIVVRRLAE